MKYAKLRHIKQYTTCEGHQVSIDLNSVAAVETVGKFTQLYLPGCKVLLKDVTRQEVLKEFESA